MKWREWLLLGAMMTGCGQGDDPKEQKLAGRYTVQLSLRTTEGNCEQLAVDDQEINVLPTNNVLANPILFQDCRVNYRVKTGKLPPVWPWEITCTASFYGSLTAHGWFNSGQWEGWAYGLAEFKGNYQGCTGAEYGVVLVPEGK